MVNDDIVFAPFRARIFLFVSARRSYTYRSKLRRKWDTGEMPVNPILDGEKTTSCRWQGQLRNLYDAVEVSFSR